MDRSSRNNIRIVIIPEGIDQSKFVSDWLITFGRDLFTPLFLIVRAHRISGNKSDGSTSPRTMICRVLDYWDKDAIMRLSQETSQIVCDGSRIRFFSDYSNRTQEMSGKG